jgi:hypothetical protein
VFGFKVSEKCQNISKKIILSIKNVKVDAEFKPVEKMHNNLSFKKKFAHSNIGQKLHFTFTYLLVTFLA